MNILGNKKKKMDDDDLEEKVVDNETFFLNLRRHIGEKDGTL